MKEIKENACRQPPEPATGHGEIDEWLVRLMPDLVPVVRAPDESIRAAVPDLEYAVKYERAFYGRPELGWIIELAPYDVSVNVLFFARADFEPRPHSDRPIEPATSRSRLTRT